LNCSGSSSNSSRLLPPATALSRRCIWRVAVEAASVRRTARDAHYMRDEAS
jgi:hypothetical protein